MTKNLNQLTQLKKNQILKHFNKIMNRYIMKIKIRKFNSKFYTKKK